MVVQRGGRFRTPLEPRAGPITRAVRSRRPAAACAGQRHDLGAARDLQAGILLDHRRWDGQGSASATVPYLVSKALAGALGEAIRLGLLDGPAWLSWPPVCDGPPFMCIWDGIALSDEIGVKN